MKFQFVEISKLVEFSNNHDKVAHYILALIMFWLFVGLGLLWCKFNWSHSITFMVCIELVQIDIFGISGRVRDTLLDLVADTLGILTGLLMLGLILAHLV